MPDFIESFSFVIDNNWLIHETPGLNPDWFGEIRLLEIKKFKNFIKN